MPPRKGLTAADIMTERVVTGGPHDGLWRIANEMQRHNIGLIVIVAKERYFISTERDFVRIVEHVGALLENKLVYTTSPSPFLPCNRTPRWLDVIKSGRCENQGVRISDCAKQSW